MKGARKYVILKCVEPCGEETWTVPKIKVSDM